MGSGFKMPTADDIWDWKLPSISIDDPMDSMYTVSPGVAHAIPITQNPPLTREQLLQGNLPYEFGEKLYPNPRYSLHGSSFLENFLDGDEYLPFLRFTSTLVLLDKLAADPFFEEGDRRHVDREKVAMFFRILGGEIPIDSKTSKGSSFNADTIADFPSQARSVVDQCQFWAHITKWGDMAFLLMIPKEPLEALFNNFQSQVKSPVGTEELRQKLIRGEEGIAGLQQFVYSLYIKLGILERALQRASHTRTEGDKFPITRQCIVDLCNELAIATVGGLDDTTRSQIRAVRDG